MFDLPAFEMLSPVVIRFIICGYAYARFRVTKEQKVAAWAKAHKNKPTKKTAISRKSSAGSKVQVASKSSKNKVAPCSPSSKVQDA